MKALDLHLQLLAQPLVERAQRLVHQQRMRLEDQRPGEGDALLLAAGELVGTRLASPPSSTTSERLLHPLGNVGLGRSCGGASGKATLSQTFMCGKSA